ncbi:gluconate:H+ symporter [Limosilactobacillus caviae]|uniref:Idonate transporter n=1 Tax=Limosilactobacillus caviae TaxID=1769424 RepID=A0ABQ2C6T2_9LACO|nr:gluconate:H+ symporter [Limosilactobacillus caviae]MCD7124444.1 gluconate:H+ symporter [Limosilactobacillus caviae]MRH45775.1 gluconate permease [Limosilactobacillus reuteri]GGI63049.1 idonate transporter [Limosilactobacillus caviae]
MPADIVSLIWIGLGIGLLVYLIVGLKLHNIIALLLAGLFIAFAEGMPITKVVPTVEKGIGGVLSTLALIVIFGAIVGELMTESGASQQIADTIVSKMGRKYLSFALLIIGMIFGMSMFYEVAFLITAPLVISIAQEAKIPYMRLIIPTVAGATMGHSIFPPQPGPMALVTAFHADIAQVYIWGFVVVIPTIICSGILVRHFITGLDSMPLGNVMKPAPKKPKNELPSFGISLLVPLLPAIIIIISSLFKSISSEQSMVYKVMSFLGSADISMLITVIIAMIVFGYARGKSGKQVTAQLTKAIQGISNVLLVIAAGGVMKEVIIDTGVGNIIVQMFGKLPVSPFILAWLITVLIRILTGQGAVAAITAAGIVAPMVTMMHVSPVLMVLACACGSNTMTLMYDGGFLLFQQSFGISLKDTFKTWDALELVNSVVGLAMVLLLSLFVH